MGNNINNKQSKVNFSYFFACTTRILNSDCHATLSMPKMSSKFSIFWTIHFIEWQKLCHIRQRLKKKSWYSKSKISGICAFLFFCFTPIFLNIKCNNNYSNKYISNYTGLLDECRMRKIVKQMAHESVTFKVKEELNLHPYKL